MSSISDKSTISLVISLLETRDKLRLGASVCLIFIGSVLELLSLGLVVPVVSSLVNGDMRKKIDWLPSQIQSLSFTTFVSTLMLLLVLAFIAKNLFLMLSGYYQQRVQLALSNRLTHTMFERYIRQPYEFHLTHASSLLLRNVQEYSSAVVTQGINPALILTSELLTALGYFVVLIIIEPFSTLLLVGLFVIAILTFNRFSKERTKEWGKQRILARGLLTDTLLSGFGAIKEIKISGRDSEFINTHRESLQAVGRLSYLFGLLQSLPRAVFEIMVVTAVSVTVTATIVRGDDLGSATLIIALFGVAAFRLLPAANRVTTALQALSFGRAGILGAVESFKLAAPTAVSKHDRARLKFSMLVIQNLTYHYPRSASTVLTIQALTIRSGEYLGIVGPSGSGKSTLADLLTGVLSPTSGRILIDGQDMALSPRRWMNQIGYVPQSVFLMDASITRNVAFGIPESEIDHGRVEASLRSANLWHFVSNLPETVKTRVGERGVRLSGGQRQRLGIARALYSDPQVLVLDEATSALDNSTEDEVVESIRGFGENRTVIVIAHRLSTIRDCTRVIRLENGRITHDGAPSDVIDKI